MTKTAVSSRKARKSVRWLKLLTICAVLFALFHLGQQYIRYQGILQDVAACEQQLQETEAEYEALQQQLALLSNDSYLEQIARTNLGMVKEGEIVVSPAQITDMPVLNKNLKDVDIIH